MTIAFPRALPDELAFVGITFVLEPMIEVTPLRSGRTISHDLGPALWRGRWQSDKLMPDKAGVVRAWYDTLMSEQAFLGYDKLREFPLAYPGGFGGLLVGGLPFTGNCKIESVAGNNVEIVLKELAVGFVFSPGDYLAFDYGADSRALHRCSAAATAGGDGRVTIEVRPHVRIGWAANAVVSLFRPAARMIILPGTWEETVEAPFYWRASFESVQTL